MLRFCGGDPLLLGPKSPAITADCDDLEAATLQLIAEVLPDRQVKSTASIRRPKQDQSLLAVRIRQRMLGAADIGQDEVGSVLRLHCVIPLPGRRAEIPSVSRSVVRKLLLNLTRKPSDVEPLRRIPFSDEFRSKRLPQRHAQLAFADPLRLELPTRCTR